jgi:hypothetical protein
MVDPRLLAPESACSMELDNGSNVLLAAHAPGHNIGLGIVSGPFSDPLGQYRISYLLDALHRALMLSGKDRADQASVRLMFSAPDTFSVRCLIMCVEESKTAVIVAHRSAEYDNAGGEE